MSRKDSSKYCVIHFLEKPFEGIDEYVCVPSSWIRKSRPTDEKVLVYYPAEHLRDTERNVEQQRSLSKTWRIYTAVVIYKTDSYGDAQKLIKVIIKTYSCENKCSRIKNTDHKLSKKKKLHELRQENKLNYNMTAAQEFVVMKNDESATKIRLKRVSTPKSAPKTVKIRSNVATSGSIKLPDSDNEIESSSNESSESSNENKLSQTDNKKIIKQSSTAKHSNDSKVERPTNDENSTQKSTNERRSGIQSQANQQLDPRTIAKDNFLSGFFMFLRELPASFGDIKQLSASFIKNPEKTKEALKSIINHRSQNSNTTTATTSKSHSGGVSAGVLKTSGRKRNVATDKEESLKKYSCHRHAKKWRRIVVVPLDEIDE